VLDANVVQAMGGMEGNAGNNRGAKMAAATDSTVEKTAAFTKRVTSWWNQTIVTHTGGNVLVATHGGVIITLVQQLLGSRKLKCAPGVVVWKCLNASVTVIEITNRKGVLVQYSGVDHLAGIGSVESNADVV